MTVSFDSGKEGDDIFYTLDGSIPTTGSLPYYGPFQISKSCKIGARRFRNGVPVSETNFTKLSKLAPQESRQITGLKNGLNYKYFEGVWDSLPNFNDLKALKSGQVKNIDLSGKNQKGEHYGFEFSGYLKVPEDGVYSIFIGSDDGSRLWLNGSLAINNDRLQGLTEKSTTLALKAGFHEIKIRYFNKTGGDGLTFSWESNKITKQLIPGTALFAHD
jgi:alpha-L-fucosidase